jgi:putative membrane protein
LAGESSKVFLQGVIDMRTDLRTVLLIASVLGSVLYLAQAQDKVSDKDRAFLTRAAQANMAEVETGKLAQEKSMNGEIKKFGQKMAEDHGKTLKELQSLAKKKGETLPASIDEPHQAQATALSRASGKEFDLMYVKEAGVADHKAAQQLFEDGTKSKDADIKAFAKKVLPDIQHHLQMAESMSKKMD